jgi:U3 small nucleolar RNA-associated protein 14
VTLVLVTVQEVVTPTTMARTKNQIVTNHTRLSPPALQMQPDVESSEVSSSSEESSSEDDSSSTESSSDEEEVSFICNLLLTVM